MCVHVYMREKERKKERERKERISAGGREGKM